jgi:hypothetical protein
MTSDQAAFTKPWIDESGFLRAKTNAGVRRKGAVERTLTLAEKLVDEPVPMVCDVRGMNAVTPDAWAYFIRRVGVFASSLAFVVSHDTAPVDSFQQAINSLLIPCRVFEDEAAATAWLRTVDV